MNKCLYYLLLNHVRVRNKSTTDQPYGTRHTNGDDEFETRLSLKYGVEDS